MGSLSRPSDACLRLHLLDDDSEWDKALEEASVFQMPRQLRSLFVTICIQCTPSEPALLWQRHKAMLAEDFARTVGEQEGEQLALREICEILTWNNKNYSDLHLPVVDIDAVHSGRFVGLIR